MTTLVPVTGFLDEPTFLTLPDTAVNDVLSLAAGTKRTVTVHGIVVVNADSAARVCTVWVTIDATDYPIWTKSVAADTTEECIQAPFKLSAKLTARKIRAQAESATADTVTVTLITSTASQSGT